MKILKITFQSFLLALIGAFSNDENISYQLQRKLNIESIDNMILYSAENKDDQHTDNVAYGISLKVPDKILDESLLNTNLVIENSPYDTHEMIMFDQINNNEDLDYLYMGVSKDFSHIMSHISSRLLSVEMVYNQTSRISSNLLYDDYEELSSDSIILIGPEYFTNRPNNKPLSSEESLAFEVILVQAIENNDSETLQAFLNPYDEDRVKFFAENIAIIAEKYTTSYFNRFRVLMGLSEFFLTITTILPSDAFDLQVEILNSNTFKLHSYKLPCIWRISNQKNQNIQIGVPTIVTWYTKVVTLSHRNLIKNIKELR